MKESTNFINTYERWKMTSHRETAAIILAVVILCSGSVEGEDFCQFETFSPQCAPGEVIIMRSAVYGRMKPGRCIERDYGYIGCDADVLKYAHNRCSGRRACAIDIPDVEFDKFSPCPKDLRRYMAAEFTCQPVYSPERAACYSQAAAVLTSPTELLASAVTEETGCGDTDTPWIIRGEPGQKVNLTLHDFSLTPNTTSAATPGVKHCHVYAILKERASGQSTTMCGGGARTQMYMSTTESVEVRILTGSGGKNKYFLLEYHLSGCPSPKAVTHGWVKRDGNKAVIGCHESGDTWPIRCEGDAWVGDVGACSVAVRDSTIIGRMNLPPAFSIVIIVAVAFGIGVLILLTGLVCLRKMRQRDLNRALREQQSAYTPYKHDMGSLPPTGPPLDLTYSSPPGYYTHTDTSGENEYEYVDDLKLPPPPQQSNNGFQHNAHMQNVMVNHNAPTTLCGGGAGAVMMMMSHNGPGISSHNAPAGGVARGNQSVVGTGTGCIMHGPYSSQGAQKSGTVGGRNEYVPESGAPKYFDLDNQRSEVKDGLKARGEIGAAASSKHNKRDFGHYSQ